MSYTVTTIVFFGIELSQEEAKRIKQKYFSEEFFPSEGNYDPLDFTDDTVHNQSGVNTGRNRERNMPQMLADGTDSRIHNMDYEEGHQHYIGIYLASKGYAYNDKIKDFMKVPSEKAVQNFEKYIRPILIAEGIEKEPDIEIVTQTW